MLFLKSTCGLAYFCHSSLIIFSLIIVWAYGAMETHQTSDLRIAGSIPAMLVFLLLFFPPTYLNVSISVFSLNGNVAQSVERKSHNLKVVSSILTVPTFFAFVSSLPFVAFSLCFRLIYCMGIWRNGNASDFGSEDCRFDPCYARLF